MVPPIYRNIGYIGIFKNFWPSKVSGNEKNIAKKQFFRRKLGKLKDLKKKKKKPFSKSRDESISEVSESLAYEKWN